MPELAGTATGDNLAAVIALDALDAIRYRYLAKGSDRPELRQVYEGVSDSLIQGLYGCLDFAVERTDMEELEHEPRDYSGFARTARAEGFAALAEWFDTLTVAQRANHRRFQEARTVLQTNPG